MEENMKKLSSRNYKLRATLAGHSMDVRSVATGITSDGKEFIVSASRDKSAKVWIPSGQKEFEMYQSCEGHTNFVVCACVALPSAAHPNGLILTGGNDHTILGFEIGALVPIYRLVSHKGTVCSIAVTSSAGGDGIIVSGSWDMTAKIWRGQDNIETLIGHSQAVWVVATIPGESQILTGSADHEIRLWEKSSTLRTFRGHTDCVRDLVLLDKTRFISCSNDAQIILWNLLTGEIMNTLYGHTNFIYSLAALPNDEGFVSVGEDKALRVWNGHEEIQAIFHPALSVWSVAVMNNGDIITGSSDGVVRVFTLDPTRMAPIALQKEFEESAVQAQLSAQLELGGMKISELPGPEALLIPGKDEGVTKMVREGTNVVCYSWSKSGRAWSKVGNVVGGSGATPQTSGRVLHDGMEYDFVFNVSLDDSSAALKLPYNVTEDPWFAAQKFLERNHLDQMFLDQVANFIISNSKTIGQQTTSMKYSDPFTGGSRYIPGSSSDSSSSAHTSLAPFKDSHIQDRVRGKLKGEGVKLWLEPYYYAESKVVSDGEVVGLANRYSVELAISIDEVLESLLALQQTALQRLAEREAKNLAETQGSRR